MSSSASASAHPTDPAARAILLDAMFKNPAAPCVKYEAEDNCGKSRWH